MKINLENLRDLGDDMFKRTMMDGAHIRSMRVQKEAFFDGVIECLKELDMKEEVKKFEEML